MTWGREQAQGSCAFCAEHKTRSFVYCGRRVSFLCLHKNDTRLGSLFVRSLTFIICNNMSETEKNTPSTIQPLGNRVLVEVQDDPTQVTDAGIIIPDTVDREKPQQGKVVAVGDGRMTDAGETIPMRVKEGDTILFSKYGLDEITVDDTEYYIIGEESILAIIK